MPEIGQSLLHYGITGKLGKGGMGEVYQAKDHKLGRDLAIKVLPEEFAKDADRIARFQREAKVLASLNHPNIAAIHGLEESGGTNFLVLELVEGQTLADRIKAGQIPVEEALKLALQIAEALEAAHEKGVIHRDLKPANIKVTPDGKVKVLDFGLAKAYAGDKEEINLSNSPTLSDAATQQGVILGTAAYMSPEQAKGKAVDKRADVWAFGCVVFEMLTGRSLFSADDVSQTLARVLERQPDFSELPANLHPKIIEMLGRCLEKDVRNRYSGISDARVDIQKILTDPGGVFLELVAAGTPGRRLRGIPWLIAGMVVGAIIAGVAAWKLTPPDPRQVVRFEYQLPEAPPVRTLAVSPDGTQFVYSTAKGLYLRSVEQLTARLIAGTDESVRDPFFSPDGKSIGYFSTVSRQLKKISVNGGVPVVLCDAPFFSGATWGEDERITYAARSGSLAEGLVVMQISAKGGTPRLLIKPKFERFNLPQILPDGKSVLYTASTNPAQPSIVVQSFESGEPKELFPGTGGRYLPTGHIVYTVGSNILAVPFDPKTLRTTGGAVTVIEGVSYIAAMVPQYALSNSGTLVYVPGAVSAASFSRRTLVWVDRKGKEELVTAPPNAYAFPRISPEGTRIAVSIGRSPNSNIWIWDIIRQTMTRLTMDETTDIYPLWTLDGRRIAFSTIVKGRNTICWKPADGTGKQESLTSATDNLLGPVSWTRDGKSVIMELAAGPTAAAMLSLAPQGLVLDRRDPLQVSSASQAEISVLSLEGDRTVKPLLEEKFAVANPQISPDGRWLAYASYESGQLEVYVRPFPQIESGRWTISTGGGIEPRWSPNGRELFYRNGDAMMAVPVSDLNFGTTKGPAFKAGTPVTLFRQNYYSFFGHQWDLSPDGKRFLMIKPEATGGETSTGQRINVILNWTEELKQRVPVK